jgi:hypothetical protein
MRGRLSLRGSNFLAIKDECKVIVNINVVFIKNPQVNLKTWGFFMLYFTKLWAYAQF